MHRFGLRIFGQWLIVKPDMAGDNKHVLSAKQFTTAQLESIFNRADFFKSHSGSLSARRRLADTHRGRQLCSVFFQPSTRTRLSFETAATKLGIGVVSTENARESSSSTKGETLEDTIRILNGYDYDLIVMRHHEVGAARRAAAVSKTPIINAGDGKGEHPTQAVLDAYTIYKNHGRLDGLKIVMGGDLRYGRTIRSLCQILSKYKSNQISFVSDPQLQVNEDVKRFLTKNGQKFRETADLNEALKDADVVYWTRLQLENIDADVSMKNVGFNIDGKALKALPKTAIIMHPLPRVDEISQTVDKDRRAKYFEQAANGLYIRMAIIDNLLQSKL